ncbi:hypothetical protein CEP51_014407 [Fusarium floridanum]|uniref:Uncharacterized protein n=1 Tax=Fusarium floridanum TaxID=1325733 RepID=A0A428PTN7_9HYPO|nr:hypothetical protein CEP51_014407 [Fusarium floridanum]
MMILWASHEQHPVQLHEPWEKAFVAYWSVNCSMGPEFYKSRLQMSLRRSVDGHGILDGPWKADTSDIETVLSLWLWSMKEPTKGYDEEDPDIKTVEPRINRILSVHSDTAHTDVADRDDDIHEAMQLSLWHKRANNGLKTYKSRNYRLVQVAEFQHAVWWREGDQFVTDSEGPPAASNDRRRFFGWRNMKKGPMKGLSVFHEMMPSNSSLPLNYAQELYSTFLTAITQAVEDLGGNSQATRYGEFIGASNETVDEIQAALVTRGLCDADEAFACTIPTLRTQGLLQPPEEVIAMVGKLADNHLKQKRWNNHEQDPTEAKEATKKLRALVIDNCKGFLQALEGDDEASIAGYRGIVHLLDRYSKDETIKNIPYAESDQGTGSGGGSGAQVKSLADIIVYCGEAARSRLEQKYPLSAGSEDERLLSRLREHGMWKD